VNSLTLQFFHALLAMTFGVTTAYAQAPYPDRTIELVVPQPAGGVNDLPARLLADKLQKRYGQPVIVVNKPGAGGNIGAQAVARAKPDGYSLLLNGSGMVFNAALGTTPFKFPQDVSVIAKIADFPSVVTIRADIPVTTVEEFAKWTQQNPGKANFGSAGVGSGGHVFGSAFMKETGATMTHIPFVGGPAAVNGMLSGDIAMFIAPMGLVKAYIDSGKLRALAVTSDRRLPALSSVPTMAEAGYPKFVAGQWFGVFGPAGMPVAIVEKLNRDIGEILADSNINQELARAGIIIATEDPSSFRKKIEEEVVYWTKRVKETGVRKD